MKHERITGGLAKWQDNEYKFPRQIDALLTGQSENRLKQKLAKINFKLFFYST